MPSWRRGGKWRRSREARGGLLKRYGRWVEEMLTGIKGSG